MSVYAMSLVFQSGLEKSQKAITLSYADHAHDDGTNIYPSVAYTAWKTGYSTRSVQRITKELIKNGYIVKDGRGKMGTNRYKIIFNKLPKREPFSGGDIYDIDGGDILSGGDNHDTEGVTTTTFRGDTVTPKPLVKHKETIIKSDDDFSKVFNAYENNIAGITPMSSELIEDAVNEFGANDIIEAIGIAVRSDARSWNYINGILKRWRKDGKQKLNTIKVGEGGGMYV